MSLKVASATTQANAPVRQALAQNAAPTSLFREVGAATAGVSVGPEGESLNYNQDWDELAFQRRRQDRGQVASRRSVGASARFGDILTTQDISRTLMVYRSTGGTAAGPLMRQGVARYEAAMRAIGTAGRPHAGGGQANWRV
jgi:hypothetical protein